MQFEYPELFSFARNKSISVSELFTRQHIEDLFSLPLSAEAFEQLQSVQSFIDHFPLTDQEDCWKSN